MILVVVFIGVDEKGKTVIEIGAWCISQFSGRFRRPQNVQFFFGVRILECKHRLDTYKLVMPDMEQWQRCRMHRKTLMFSYYLTRDMVHSMSFRVASGKISQVLMLIKDPSM